MTNSSSDFNYPIVFKYIHGFMTISIPDLGIQQKIKMDSDFFSEKKWSFTSSILINMLKDVLESGAKHVQEKKWIPSPSQIKNQLKPTEKDFSLPEFQKQISKFFSVSENTLRREMAKGEIIFYTTEGGHRRIPESEIHRYLKNKNILST